MEIPEPPHEDQLLLLRYRILCMQIAQLSNSVEHPFIQQSIERDPLSEAKDQADMLSAELVRRGIETDDSDIL